MCAWWGSEILGEGALVPTKLTRGFFVMRLMTLGFLFDPPEERVLLVHKTNGPAPIRGKWNGIGGKVEPNETVLDCMKREAWEEALVKTPAWREYASMDGHDWAVFVFKAQLHTEVVGNGDEGPTEWFFVRDVIEGKINTPYNLKWLIPLALEPDRISAGVIYHG